MYTEKVMRFFRKPQNVGTIEHPDGYGYLEDAANTNVIEIFLKVQGGRIREIKFRTLGVSRRYCGECYGHDDGS